jgi:hypothetical protein
MARKQSVPEEVQNEEVQNEEVVANNTPVEQSVPEEVQTENKKGMLFSRLNYAAKYIYNKEECMITPKGKIKIDNVDLIEQPLKPGLLLRKID